MLDKICRIGWIAVEIGLILVSLAILLNIILGTEGGPAVTSIAENATAFLLSLPAGTLVGLAALWVLYIFARSRLKA